jgi:transposase-like protein
MSEVRAVPFYCPFCGEQDLRPGDPTGWRCTSCERRFELKVTGVGPSDASTEGGDGA